MTSSIKPEAHNVSQHSSQKVYFIILNSQSKHSPLQIGYSVFFAHCRICRCPFSVAEYRCLFLFLVSLLSDANVMLPFFPTFSFLRCRIFRCPFFRLPFLPLPFFPLPFFPLPFLPLPLLPFTPRPMAIVSFRYTSRPQVNVKTLNTHIGSRVFPAYRNAYVRVVLADNLTFCLDCCGYRLVGD